MENNSNVFPLLTFYLNIGNIAENSWSLYVLTCILPDYLCQVIINRGIILSQNGELIYLNRTKLLYQTNSVCLWEVLVLQKTHSCGPTWSVNLGAIEEFEVGTIDYNNSKLRLIKCDKLKSTTPQAASLQKHKADRVTLSWCWQKNWIMVLTIGCGQG